MARLTARITLIEVVLALGALAVVARAAQLQLVQGKQWRAEADRVRRERVVLEARRGGIFDRNGVALALTQEYFQIGVAPNELRDPPEDTRLIARSLGLSLASLRQALATRRWVAYRGPFSGLQVQPLRPLRGVHLFEEFARHYPAGSLARAVVGALDPDSGQGASGVELALDSLLTGTPGEAVVLKDRAGRRYDSPSRLGREPVPGHDVYLTIDAELQEIAERALDDAMTEYDAAGGDIVMLDPGTGELLALASRDRVDGKIVASRATFFTDPFEPGSTAKLFTAAALLSLGRVDSTDEVYGEHGAWEMPVNSRGGTRLIRDDHQNDGSLTLAQAIRVSSNIAMAKFSQRLTAVEQYEALRDFGFGSPTGVEFPSEAPGKLRLPDRWDGYSKASIAMGYELQVTPVQLAAAYAAIANNGVLLTPTLVREVRSGDGSLVYRHRPEPVRRAVSPEVAARLRAYLRSVVQAGTGEGAQLSNYTLAGKTGTALQNEGGHYTSGHYTASFAAIFPADDPQLVVVVKIDDPRGKYYGGQTAAPLTRTMLEEALAARRSAIDRARLVQGTGTAESEASEPEPEPEPEQATGDVVVPLPLVEASSASADRRPVPNVEGVSLRRAANALHRRGFRVTVRGTGHVFRTVPAAGDSANAGAVVTVWAEE